MASVKCNACGKRYDYYEHGCCPECGAYNRPPRRDRVDADGTVHHISDADFLNNTEKRRRSQSGKVCFEQDSCFEEPPRRVRSHSTPDGGSDSPFNRVMSRNGGKKKSKPARIVAGVIIAVMIVNILPLLLTMCSVSDVLDSVEDFFVVDVTPVRPEPVPSPADKPQPDGETEYSTSVGNTFIWWDNDAAVTEVSMNEWDGFAELDLTMWRVEGYDEPVIYYDTTDGWQEKAGCESVTQPEDNIFIYHYILDGWASNGECYAFFDGYNGNTYCEVKVPLTVESASVTQAEHIVQFGEWVTVGTDRMAVREVTVRTSGRITEISILVESIENRYGTWPVLSYTTTDGEPAEAEVQSYVAKDGYVTYRYQAKDLDEEAPYYAVFTNNTGPYTFARVVLN